MLSAIRFFCPSVSSLYFEKVELILLQQMCLVMKPTLPIMLDECEGFVRLD